jgi:amino acid adenylation domain-containing protein
MLQGITEDPTQRVYDISLLSKVETEQLLYQWNDTQAEYPKEKCIHELFEAQVEKVPDATAVVFENESFTYRELNAQANQLAYYLIEKGVKPDTLVGLCVERSFEMMVGLFGILKAGGAYVPIDPSYPAARIQHMIEDSGIKDLITQTSQFEQLSLSDPGEKEITNGEDKNRVTPFCIDTAESKSVLKTYPETNLSVEQLCLTPSHLAYVIYTSGSTGKPKGVEITHGSVINFLCSMEEEVGVSEKDKLLAITSLSFDIAVLELFLPLKAGAQIIISSSSDKMDAVKLQENIRKHQVTVLQGTPVTWQLLIDTDWRKDEKGVFKVLSGGEALPRQLAQQLLERNVTLYNMYGPTETTIWSTMKTITQDITGNISIGKAIANTTVYILDSKNLPTPIGVPGELHIGGAGLARGYLKRPELTAEKFIKNPFIDGPVIDGPVSDEPESRLYKTGDLVRYLADGNIEYLGRMDDQLKVRGFRIELGEIEACLRSKENVKAAVVVAREDKGGVNFIVAYAIIHKEENIDGSPEDDAKVIQEMRNHLRTQLPEHMIPSAFVLLDEFPLTPNGKTDKKALPAPDISQQTAAKYVAPTTEIQHQLTWIWAEVLGVEKIGIEDNFFDLGGHSLLATRVVALIRQSLQIELPLLLLFSEPTIKQLELRIEEIRFKEEQQSLISELSEEIDDSTIKYEDVEL